jgi:hypothetical protein
MAENSELWGVLYARKRVRVFCCLLQNARSGTGAARSSVFSPGPCVLKSMTVGFCLSELRFLRSCAFFTHFCFELALGVNMKVLDKDVSFQWLWFNLKMIFRFWMMVKILQVGLGKILRKFSITFFKWTQKLWFDSKTQNLSTGKLTRMFKSI